MKSSGTVPLEVLQQERSLAMVPNHSVVGSDVVVVDQGTTASTVDSDIAFHDEYTAASEHAVAMGVESAFEEIDDAAFGALFDLVEAAFVAGVECRAKRMTTQLLRDLVTKAERSTATV